MQSNKSKLFMVLALILSIGIGSAFGAVSDKKKKDEKRPKNTGVLSVKTTPNPLTVRVDGQVVGVAGTIDAAEFYLTPGPHTVEIEGPNGVPFVKEINVVKDVKNCICLNVVERVVTKKCPYDISVSAPTGEYEDGSLVTFVTLNAVTGGSALLNYVWNVSPGVARVTSGLGTNAITIDTTGLGGQTITANLEVTDGIYDASCRQRVSASVFVKEVKIEVKESILFDEFPTIANDDDKARLDGYAVELQNNPSYKGYIIMYPGTDSISKTRTPERLAKMALDYLVNQRGIDPSRLSIVQGGSRPRTTYQMWLVPPGAETPVPND